MPVLHYIEPDVDLFEFPKVHDFLKPDVAVPDDELVLGDLHASTIKLVYVLVRHGVISGITQTGYRDVVKLCTTPAHQLVKSDLHDFREIFSRLSYSTHLILSLIGDDLGDRWESCDVFTMILIAILLEKRVRVKIHVSNHTSQMIEACELKTTFDSTLLVESDCRSMHAVEQLISKKELSHQDVYDLYNKGYKKALVAFSFFQDTHPDGKKIVYLISHAGIDFRTIDEISKYLMTDTQLADPLNVRYAQFMQVSSEIEKTFKAVVEGNLIHQLYDPLVVGKAYEGECNLRAFPFEEMMWNRRVQGLRRDEVQQDFYVRYIHGHHLVDTAEKNVCNLDNILGKSALHHKGDYTIVYKTAQQLPKDFVQKFQFSTGDAIVASKAVRASYALTLFSHIPSVASNSSLSTMSREASSPNISKPEKKRLSNRLCMDSESSSLTASFRG